MTGADEGNRCPMLDLSALRTDIADLRDSVRQIPAPHDGELRTELESLRQDLHAAFDAWRAQPVPAPSEDVNVVPVLADRMTELEVALVRTQEEQQRMMAERDEQLYRQLGELHSAVSSALEESGPPVNEDPGESWQGELAELRREIAAFADGAATPAVHDDSAIIELVSALRNEMRDALEAIRASDSSSDGPLPVNRPSRTA